MTAGLNLSLWATWGSFPGGTSADGEDPRSANLMHVASISFNHEKTIHFGRPRQTRHATITTRINSWAYLKDIEVRTVVGFSGRDTLKQRSKLEDNSEHFLTK